MMLPVLNLNEATFDCTFGRGCDGVCCRNGRPPIYPDEQVILDANLSRILPALRPAARALVEAQGYLSRRVKAGLHSLRVINGWCVFFNRGCVLHRMGAAEGNTFRYKPSICAIFPLGKDEHNQWYVRQKGYKGEIWDLPCLDPAASAVRAEDSLRDEIALALSFPI